MARQKIKAYIQAYNSLDVEGMLEVLSEEVVFENYSQGKLDLRLEGKTAFREQAEQAVTFFQERKQNILDWQWGPLSTTVKIAFFAVVAKDLPNGLKKGQELELEGASEFFFEQDQIVKIVDRS